MGSIFWGATIQPITGRELGQVAMIAKGLQKPTAHHRISVLGNLRGLTGSQYMNSRRQDQGVSLTREPMSLELEEKVWAASCQLRSPTQNLFLFTGTIGIHSSGSDSVCLFLDVSFAGFRSARLPGASETNMAERDTQ